MTVQPRGNKSIPESILFPEWEKYCSKVSGLTDSLVKAENKIDHIDGATNRDLMDFYINEDMNKSLHIKKMYKENRNISHKPKGFHAL